MSADYEDKSSRSFIDFSALKTAIVNSETDKVKSMLNDRTIQSLEKDYLLDLAKMNDNQEIVDIIKQTSN